MTDRQVKSNVEWAYWGRRDPMWGVAAWPGRKRGDVDAWGTEEFYELGRSDWQDFRSLWLRYGLTAGTALEIGCGAGRLTLPMSHDFEHVEAIDVSEDMLEFARTHCTSPNIRFHKVDGATIPLKEASVDAVLSTHVFQHLDSAGDVRCYFSEIMRTLRPGGSMMIHLPLHQWPCGSGRVSKGLYRLEKSWESLVAKLKRLAIRSQLDVGLMRMHSYEPDWLREQLEKEGFSSIEFVIVPVTSNRALHPFVMARKKEPSHPPESVDS